MATTLLSEVLDEVGPPVRYRGEWCLRWPCPLCHDDRPVFYIVDDAQRFICKSCHREGDILTYLRYRHPELTPAQLAALVGVKPESEEERSPSSSHVAAGGSHGC